MRAEQKDQMMKLVRMIQNERDPAAFAKFVHQLVALLQSVERDMVASREKAGAIAGWAARHFRS